VESILSAPSPNPDAETPPQPPGGLLRSTATVGSMTLLSRVLGLLRDIVFANLFGVSGRTDAFFVAFKIPNFLRRLFAEGAFSQAFVPVLTEYKTRRSRAELVGLVNAVAGTLGTLLLGLTVLGMLGAPVLISIFAGGFLMGDDTQETATRFAYATEMLRITFPYLLLISLTAFAGSILNTYGRFAVPAVTPVFLNLSLISCAIWLSPHLDPPVYALAWGVLIAGVVQLGFQLPYLARLGLLPRPRWGWREAGVEKIKRLMLPALFGSSVAQINLLFDTLIASFLVTGSITWLYYSDRLLEFPLGVFGIALATVILPSLSREHAQASPERFSRTLDWALRLSAVLAVPAAAGLAALAVPILATLFQHGDFTAQDTRLASYSLMAYACGLPAFVLIKILAPGFYARQNTATPVRIGIIAMVANMGLNLLFVLPLVWLGSPGPHAGLAAATSLSGFLQAYLLHRRLRREAVYRPEAGWPGLLLRVILATVAMVLVLAYLQPAPGAWSGYPWTLRIGHLLALVGAGALTYFLVLLVGGFRFAELRR
jgi:putative peptidoglycan lipid II flippase